VPKSDSTWRPVINLKGLNQFVLIQHFKMESVRTVKGDIQKGDWLLKLDLKDAYLSVRIHKDHQKYLRFLWENRAWQFRALPFGLSSAPQTFYETPKTSGLHSEEAGYSSDSLSGRHADNGPVQTRNQGSPGHNNEAAVCPRVHYQYEEERVHSNQEHRVSGIHIGLISHDHQVSINRNWPLYANWQGNSSNRRK
jgi:hypothetical protein